MIKQRFEHFQKIAYGGLIFSLGSVGSLVIQFLIGIIVVRAISRFDYGLISLTLIFMNILVTLVILGFSNGIPRLMAQYNGKNQPASVQDIIDISLGTVLITSIFASVAVFLNAEFIASLFTKPEMVPALEVFALVIFPFAFIRILGAIFRGIEDIKPKVYFIDLTMNGSRFLLIIFVLLVGLGFRGIIWSYVISFWLAFFGLWAYGLRKSLIRLPTSVNFPVARKLVSFSVPLLGVSIIDNLMGWTGILMLGYFQSNEEISLYSAPLRLATILQIPMISLVYLYLPLSTRLLFSSSKRDLGELGDLYVRTTKVAFFIILPVILFFLADAEFVVRNLFGENYESAANVLRLLTIGFSFHILMGPNSTTLTSLGNTYMILVGSTLAGLSVVGFCFLLIPSYGASGAAISMALSRFISNAFFSVILFKFYRIHPFLMDFVKPLLFSLVLGIIAFYCLQKLSEPHFLIHILFFIVLLAITILSPFLTRSIREGDIDLLRKIETKISGRTAVADWIGGRVLRQAIR